MPLVLTWASAFGFLGLLSEFCFQICVAQPLTTGNVSMEIVKQAFVVNYEGNSISVCTIGSDGMFNDCNNFDSGFRGPIDIALAGDKAYVTNLSKRLITVCDILSNGSLVNCMAGARQFGTYSRYFIDVTGERAYLTNRDDDRITVCAIISDGALASCDSTSPNTMQFDAPRGIAVNGEKAYVANGNNSVSVCDIQESNSMLTNCYATETVFDVPHDISIQSNRIYISNFGGDSITVCDIDGSDGGLTNCRPTGSELDGPFDIALDQEWAYATIPGGTFISICDIDVDSDQVLQNCRDTGSRFTRITDVAFSGDGSTAYVVSAFSVYLCKVSASEDGSLNECRVTGYGFNNPYGITVEGSMAYVSELYRDIVLVCAIEADGELINCRAAAEAFDGPKGITISSGRAYVANDVGDSVSVCDIARFGVMVNCGATENFVSPIDSVISGNKTYITSFATDTLYVCDLAEDGKIFNCESRTEGFSGPVQAVMYNEDFLLVTNRKGGTISRCELSNTGNILDCREIEFWRQQPRSIAVLGNRAYISNMDFREEVIVCKVAEDGLLEDCSSTETQFQYPAGIQIRQVALSKNEEQNPGAPEASKQSPTLEVGPSSQVPGKANDESFTDSGLIPIPTDSRPITFLNVDFVIQGVTESEFQDLRRDFEGIISRAAGVLIGWVENLRTEVLSPNASRLLLQNTNVLETFNRIYSDELELTQETLLDSVRNGSLSSLLADIGMNLDNSSVVIDTGDAEASPTPSSSSSSVVAVAVGVTVGVLGALFLVAGFLFCRHRRKENQLKLRGKKTTYMRETQDEVHGIFHYQNETSLAIERKQLNSDTKELSLETSPSYGKSENASQSSTPLTDSKSAKAMMEIASQGNWVISSREIEILHDSLGLPIALGEGFGGQIFKACRGGVQEVAVKVVNSKDPSIRQACLLEAEMMKVLHDRSIIHFFGVCKDGRKLYLVMEYMPGGSLADVIASPRNWKDLAWYKNGRKIVLDIIRGISYLHSKNIIHRNINSKNIFLNETFTSAKIGNVGMSRFSDGSIQKFTIVESNNVYTAPEIVASQAYGQSSDIYSFGVVLREFLTLNSPTIKGPNRNPTREECPEEIFDMLSRCLSVNPHKRPTAFEIYHIVNNTV